MIESVVDRIISLYAMGNCTHDIIDWMEENRGTRVSVNTINFITDCILMEIKVQNPGYLILSIP